MQPTTYNLANPVRAERVRQGLTQAQLADRAYVSRDMLIKLEARNPRVELGKALAVCEALGIEFAIPDTDAPSKTSDSESDWGRCHIV